MNSFINFNVIYGSFESAFENINEFKYVTDIIEKETLPEACEM